MASVASAHRRNRIAVVCINMSAAYRRAVPQRLPAADILFDRSHVPGCCSTPSTRSHARRCPACRLPFGRAQPARALPSPIESLRRFARTVRQHIEGILGSFGYARLTNSVREGSNNEIKLLIDRAFGFRSTSALIAMTHPRCSGIALHIDSHGDRRFMSKHLFLVSVRRTAWLTAG